MIAVLIGPLQFFSSLRKKHPQLHRRTGRSYLFAILAGAGCAIVLAIQHNMIMQHRLAFGTGSLGLAVAWLFAIGNGIVGDQEKKRCSAPQMDGKELCCDVRLHFFQDFVYARRKLLTGRQYR